VAEKYFEKFQVINYSNNSVRNIMERVVVLNSVLKNAYAFYSYDITNGMRPDQIADTYYNDQFMDWIIYLGTTIVDPYYGWYVQQIDFSKSIKVKYGLDIPVLQSRVAFYRNDWTTGSSISQSEYDALDYSLIKYWEVSEYDKFGNPISYVRRRVDWKVNTNSIVRYSANGVGFIDGEKVSITFLAAPAGNAHIYSANSTTVVVQHTDGNILEGGGNSLSASSCIKGYESKTNSHFTAVSLVAKNISDTEASYWVPVSVFDNETEINEQNKSIRVLSSSAAPAMANQLKQLLK
jgi:hypothetical protein